LITEPGNEDRAEPPALADRFYCGKMHDAVWKRRTNRRTSERAVSPEALHGTGTRRFPGFAAASSRVQQTFERRTARPTVALRDHRSDARRGVPSLGRRQARQCSAAWPFPGPRGEPVQKP
jgi:hypothetical protein